MQYKLNDLLDDADVAELTAETFAAPKKDTRIWRRVGVLAACAVLVVGLANAGALAVGIRQVWSYITGVGAVTSQGEVWVQQGPTEAVVGDRTYRVRDAYRQDGYIYLTVDVLLQSDPNMDGERPRFSVSASLTCGEDDRACYADYGPPYDKEWRAERFNANSWAYSAEELKDEGALMGYGDVMSRLGGAAAVWSFDMCFRDEGMPSGDYRVSVWMEPEVEERFYDRPPNAQIDLTMEPGKAFPVETYRVETPYGALSLLVSDQGEKVQLLMEREEDDAVQPSFISPVNLRFVDADGRRYAGVPVQLFHFNNDGRVSPEVRIESTPGAPITAIELPGYWVTLEDTARPAVDGGRYTDYRVEDLNWNVSLK